MSKRLFYACQQVGFAKDGEQTFIPAHGVQSLGMTTNFNLSQVFELGQISIYDNLESVPDIEVTMEKVIDGKPLLYHLATNGAASTTLVGRSNVKTTVGVSLFQDTQTSATGAPVAECQMSGMVWSNLSYSFPVDGQATESLSLAGFNKVWNSNSPFVFSGQFDDTDSVTGVGVNTGNPLEVQRRQNMVFVPVSGSPTGTDVNGATQAWMTVLPTDINGITSSGTNPAQADGTFLVPVQSISISCDAGRRSIFQLGRKSLYCRYVSFPVQVSTDIEVIETSFDNINATEAGGSNGAPAGANTKNQTIRVQLDDGTRIDLGTKNRLNSYSVSGGDAQAGGSNVSVRYSYQGWSDLNVYHPEDPSSLAFEYA